MNKPETTKSERSMVALARVRRTVARRLGQSTRVVAYLWEPKAILYLYVRTAGERQHVTAARAAREFQAVCTCTMCN